MGPLAQLVGCLWLVAGGLWLAGEQLFRLAMSRSFESTQLAGGLVLFVGGLIGAGVILRRLDAQAASVEEE